MNNDTGETTQVEKLHRLIGTWEGITKTWLDPSKPPIEEKNTGSFKQVINEVFIVHEYESMMDGGPFRGMAIYGYDSASQKFQCSWIDGFHMSTAIMFSEGSPTEKGFSVLGGYVYENIKWGWRTEVEIENNDEIILRAFNISPEGKEDKALETVYKRVSK